MKRTDKRATLRQVFAHRRIDPNRVNAFRAGDQARLEGKPVTSCPDMLRLVDDKAYAVVLEKEWVNGWMLRDKAIGRPRLPLED